MTTQINFNERDNGQSIQFDGDTCEVCEGCLVDLNHAGETITVKVIECSDNQPWSGEITDSPSDTLKIGSTVQFEDRHIIRCAA